MTQISLLRCCLLVALFSVGRGAPVAEFSSAAQPQLAVTTGGRIYVAYGHVRRGHEHVTADGTWILKGCPMDGGGLVALGRGNFVTVWQRDGEIFYCPAIGAEICLGKGKQPVGIIHEGQPLVFWQQGPDLVSARPIGKAEPTRHAATARFATLASLPHNRGTILAYERVPVKGPSVVIERL